MKFSTQLIRLGQEPQPPYHPVMPPLYQSATFAWEDCDNVPAFDYTRAGNPTRKSLEQVLAGIENAKHALSLSSGMAAVATACSILRPGDHLIGPSDIYGGTFRYFERYLKPNGIEIDYFDSQRVETLESLIRPSTRLVWLETPTNPNLRIVDIRKCVEVAHRHEALVGLDNTFASPYFQKPLDLGCDISMHSTTKYINGHSDVIGGCLMWNADSLSEPFLLYAKSCGNTSSPFDAWLTLRGVKTLAVRMQRHEENATTIARYLEEHSKVTCVHYPGLTSHPGHDLAKSQMSGFGGMLAFEVKGDSDSAKRVAQSTQTFLLAESLGGVESLIGWPPVMSHAAMSEEERVSRGIPPTLLRLSVGIEDVDDLIEDLDQALSKA